jgi:hypothetical protein
LERRQAEEKAKQKEAEENEAKREKRRRYERENEEDDEDDDDEATGGNRRLLKSSTSSRRRSFPTSDIDDDHQNVGVIEVDRADYTTSYIDDDVDVDDEDEASRSTKPKAIFQECHNEFMLQLTKRFHKLRAPIAFIVGAFDDKFPGHGFQEQQLRDKFKNQKRKSG